MSKSAEIAVVLRLRDQMGGQAAKALDTLTRAARGVGQGAGAAARELGRLDHSGQGVRSVGIAAAATDKLMGGLGRTAQKASRDVAAVGQAAGAVKSVGTLAYEALRGLDQAARAGNRLRDALRGVGTAGQAALGLVKGVGQAGAGLAAASVVAGRALEKPISYDDRLTNMANVAFNDKDAAGRIEGKKELAATIQKGMDAGGGSRESAAEALQTMLAQGMESGTASRLLPQILRAAKASQSDPKDLANIALKGMQQGFFTESQVMKVMDSTVRGGELGQFETKDMGKWMPQIMSAAAGMKNKEGYERLVASLQGIAVVSGSNDQAANALFNLLGKINSQDTEKDFVKLGINLPKTLAKAAEKGKDPLTAFVELVEREVVGKDKNYQALKKRISQAKGDEKKVLLEQAADILGAGALGKVLQDREARLGFIGVSAQKERINDVLTGMRNSSGAVDTGFETANSSTASHLQQFQNEKDNAMSRMLENISGPLKAATDAATGLAREFPSLATVVASTATAIGTASAAFAGAGAYSLFTGGAGSAAAVAKTLGKGALRSAPWLIAGIEAAGTELDPTLTRSQKNVQHAQTAGETAFSLLGAQAGAMAGTAVMPGPGTIIGMLLGAIGGYVMGGKAGRDTGQWMWGDQARQDARAMGTHSPWGPSGQAVTDAQKIVVENKSTLHVESVLHIDGREVARAVNTYNTAEAKRE